MFRLFYAAFLFTSFGLFLSCSSSSDSSEPEPSTQQAPSFTTTLQGRVARFTVTSQEDISAAVSLQWDFGDGTQDSGPNPVHAYASSGTYTVTFTHTDSALHETTRQQTVTIASAPCTLQWERIQGRYDIELQGLAAGPPGVVSVGKKGEIRFSPDGLDWCPVKVDRRESFSDVIWANGRFWALGNGEIDTRDVYVLPYTAIFESENGRDWNLVATLPIELWDLTWNGNQFITVGRNAYGYDPYSGVFYVGVAWRSEDGIHWEQATDGGTSLTSIFWTGTHFLVDGIYNPSGRTPTPIQLTSSNGIDWEDASEELGSNLMATDGTTLVRIINDTISISTDGQTWQTLDQSLPAPILDLVWADHRFVAIGKDAILSSLDGRNWEEATITADSVDDLARAVHTGFLWIAEGPSGPRLHSLDGLTWNPVHTETPEAVNRDWNVVKSTDNGFVVGGRNGYLMESEDGQTWQEERVEDTFHILDVTDSAAGLLAVGTPGQIWLRSAGTWEKVHTAEFDILFVATNGQSLIAIDQTALVYHSQDGRIWQATQRLDHIQDLEVYEGQGDRHFWALGYQTLFHSTNGLNWEQTPLNDLDFARDLARVQDAWLIAGLGRYPHDRGTTFLKSSDGLQWETSTLLENHITALASNEHGFYAVGNPYTTQLDAQSGDVAVATVNASADGLSWHTEFTGAIPTPRSIAIKDGIAVMVGESGSLLVRPAD